MDWCLVFTGRCASSLNSHPLNWRRVPSRAYCTKAQQPIQVSKKDDLSSYILVPLQVVMDYQHCRQHICNLHLGTLGKCFNFLDVSNRRYGHQPSLLIYTLSPKLRTAFFCFAPIRLEGLAYNEGYRHHQESRQRA